MIGPRRVRGLKLENYLSRFEELRTLYKAVKEEFLAKGLVHHNWAHAQRVLGSGITVGEAERANMKIVLASILLHDVGRLHREAGEDHHSVGAEIAPKYLRNSGFGEDEIEQIKHCIKAHSPRGIEEPRSLEAKVCYDTDVLSCSVGCIGVARVFDYFMREEDMGIREMVTIPSGKKGPREDFYTQSGKRLGAKGFRKAMKFWKELEQEFASEEENIRKVIPDYKSD
jgi:HD superfamily phosphodiesterase